MAGRLFDRFVIRFPGAARLVMRAVLGLPSRRLRLQLVSPLLRLAYGSLSRGTFLDVFAAFIAPDVDWILPVPWPDVPDRHLVGREAVRRFYGELSTRFNQNTMPVTIQERERGVLVVHAITHIRVEGSDLEAEVRDIDEIHLRRGWIVAWHESMDDSTGTYWQGLVSGTGASF